METTTSSGEIGRLLSGGVYCLNADLRGIRSYEEANRHEFFSDVARPAADPDIRAVWEPSRLQHVTALLQYSLAGNEPDASDRAKRQAGRIVLEWLESNPFLYGPCYESAMECALRIPAMAYCLAECDLSNGEREKLLSAIYRHAWWVGRRLSLYSSLGNHTVSECAGLVFAGAVFRNTEAGKEWLESGISLLRQELNHQILPDGGPAEQSLQYHRFVLDLYWLAIQYLEINGIRECGEFRPVLLKAEEFLDAFRDEGGCVPAIGDSDDGHAVAPGIQPARPRPSIRKTRYRRFAESGYSIFRLQGGTVLTFDHGPLGMPPLHNHVHADALSLTLSKGAAQILVDPGTYRYNGAPEWRRYFKGTRAHNTVTVDGLDQAVQETGFIWSHPYRVELISAEDTPSRVSVTASHDGYSRLRKPVLHQRAVSCYRDACIVVRDTFEGESDHTYELHWHLHPDSQIVLQDGWWRLGHSAEAVFLKIFGEQGRRLVRGQNGSILGWYSPAYGVKREAGVLQCIRRGVPREVSFLTVILTDPAFDERMVEEALRES